MCSATMLLLLLLFFCSSEWLFRWMKFSNYPLESTIVCSNSQPSIILEEWVSPCFGRYLAWDQNSSKTGYANIKVSKYMTCVFGGDISGWHTNGGHFPVPLVCFTSVFTGQRPHLKWDLSSLRFAYLPATNTEVMCRWNKWGEGNSCVLAKR